MGQLVFWVFWANGHLGTVANCSFGVWCPCLGRAPPTAREPKRAWAAGSGLTFLASPGGGLARAGGRRRKREGLGGSSDAAAEDVGSGRLVKCRGGGRPGRCAG